jgi:hypothetical protein
MSYFPLYDIFSKQVGDLENLSQEQKKTLTDNIKLLDQIGLDNLYMIIRHSAKLENDEKVYGAKYNRKAVVFNLDTMPESLQKIIWCFVARHLKEMEETIQSVDIVFE